MTLKRKTQGENKENDCSNPWEGTGRDESLLFV